jgi:3-methyl-2-oxobutanoate hydroxymethyltransferase
MLVRAIVDVGIPVLGHVGVTKQKIVQSGRIRLPAQNADSAREAIADAVEMANSGAFALVLECIPDAVAQIITRGLTIPTIGIGAGFHCDGQALVTQDMLGLYKEISPRFLKVYVDLTELIVSKLGEFRHEVETGVYPGPEHTYSIDEAELSRLLAQLRTSGSSD